MINAMTVDLEDWYHTQDLGFDCSSWGNFEDRIEYGTRSILELLEKHSIRATFFVLGYVASRHPALVREIEQCGHEIASHGCYHKMVSLQTKEDFRKDIADSKALLEDISGKEVKLYRAPSWSISQDTLWALEILEEEGYTCDSSIQPFRSPLSGVSGAPLEPFHPVIRGKRLGLLEFPPTVLNIGKLRIPFAGGLYLRLLPAWFVINALKFVNRERHGVIYTHPWESDIGQPRLQVPSHIKLTHYSNLKTTLPKLDKLMMNFSFVPLGKLIENKSYPALNLGRQEQEVCYE